eukprot:1216350-Rhodomonas_salina.2
MLLPAQEASGQSHDGPGTCLRGHYAMSGTDIAIWCYAISEDGSGTCLRVYYAMSGTDIAYVVLSAYARDRRCA